MPRLAAPLAPCFRSGTNLTPPVIADSHHPCIRTSPPPLSLFSLFLLPMTCDAVPMPFLWRAVRETSESGTLLKAKRDCDGPIYCLMKHSDSNFLVLSTTGCSMTAFVSGPNCPHMDHGKFVHSTEFVTLFSAVATINTRGTLQIRHYLLVDAAAFLFSGVLFRCVPRHACT